MICIKWHMMAFDLVLFFGTVLCYCAISYWLYLPSLPHATVLLVFAVRYQIPKKKIHTQTLIENMLDNFGLGFKSSAYV